MHCLYQFDLVGGDISEIFENTKHNFRVEKDISEFSWNLISKTVENWNHLNELIVKFCENWELSRICSIDRALLRMGITELLYFSEPVSVSISEAVEIARAYSTDNSCSFVNAILDKISREMVPEKER